MDEDMRNDAKRIVRRAIEKKNTKGRFVPCAKYDAMQQVISITRDVLAKIQMQALTPDDVAKLNEALIELSLQEE